MKSKTSKTKPSEWRVIFAIDCHGGVVVKAQNEKQARALFEKMTVDDLFIASQSRRIRMLGVMDYERHALLRKKATTSKSRE